MSRQVIFHGAVLTRPGAATFVDASAFADFFLAGLGIVAIVGLADGGEPGVVKTFRTPKAVQDYYRQGDIPECAAIVSDPSNDNRIQQGASLLVCVKTNNSTKSTLTEGPFTFSSLDWGAHTNNIQLAFSNPGGGDDRVLSISSLDPLGGAIQEVSPSLGLTGKMTLQYLGLAGDALLSITATQLSLTTVASSGKLYTGDAPFNLAPNDTVIASIDGGADQTFTFLATAGTTDSAVQPYVLANGQTLLVSVNGDSPQTFTFNATAGYYQGTAGTFAALNGTSLSVKVNGGAAQTTTFTAGAVDAVTAAAEILAATTGVSVGVFNGQIRITSLREGTSSSIEITAINAAAGFPALGLGVAGTGDFSNIANATAAEVQTKIAATLVNATASVSALKVRLTSLRQGLSSTVQVTGGTARIPLGFDNLVHAGTGNVQNIDAVTANEVKTIVAPVGGVSTVVPSATVSGAFRVELRSATTGSSSSIKIQPLSTADTALSLDNLTHSGLDAAPGDNITVLFSTVPDMASLAHVINVTGKYLLTPLVGSPGLWDNTYFDAITNVSTISGVEVFARNWDVLDWVSQTSQLVSVDLTKGQAGPAATWSLTAMTGGTRGIATNASYMAALAKLTTIAKNQVVVMAPTDGIPPDTYTREAVLAGSVSHVRQQSGVAGKNECQLWFGFAGNKSDLIATANLYSSEHLCLLGQEVRRQRVLDGNVVWHAAWSSAAICAGMRAGAPPATPLTWKYVNALGVRPVDSSWSDENSSDISDFNLNGVMCLTPVQAGIRIEKGITTYTRTPNAAFESEVIVQGWKRMSRGLRTALEDTYIGESASARRISAIPSTVTAVMQQYKEEGEITNSIENGVEVNAFHDINVRGSGDVVEVDVTIHQPDGINFILGTIFTRPASFTATA